MGPRLLVEVKEIDDVNFVKLSGVIDEDNDLGELTEQINKKAVIIDASDIDRINSCGVRDWVTWLGEIDKKGCKIYLFECSPAIMTQVNLVNNFVGPGAIINFYAPYFCPSCESDKMLLIEMSDAKKDLPFKAPTCRCDECDHTMEFDDIESSYFGFLSTIKEADITDSIANVIKQVASNDDGNLRTRRTTVAPQSSTKADGQTSAPTAPSTKDLKGLLTPVPDLENAGGSAAAGDSGSNVSKMLFVVVALLVVSIGLLGYVVLTRGG